MARFLQDRAEGVGPGSPSAGEIARNRWRLKTMASFRVEGRRGFSITEVMISVAILAFITTAAITSLTFSARATRLNANAIAAKNVAQGFFERMNVDAFANVGPANYPDVSYGSSPPVYLDEGMDIKCAVTFRFKGYGALTAASAKNRLVCRSPSGGDPDWESGEWAGDTVYLVSGTGVGQYSSIASSDADSLTLDPALAFSPDATTRFMINNGKTVEVTTTWEYLGREYSQTISSLIVNYRDDDNFGF
ncbi:MAG TPA: type II secretion system protein [Sumerlaeia bacterium]|nr:type II secretion system protein [Sumerlaeia bacterium]